MFRVQATSRLTIFQGSFQFALVEHSHRSFTAQAQSVEALIIHTKQLTFSWGWSSPPTERSIAGLGNMIVRAIAGMWSGGWIFYPTIDGNGSGCFSAAELIHYLQHIKEFWHRLLRGNYSALRKLDEATVKALELKSPRYSRRDARVLQGLLMRGQIFTEFSQPEREVIWGDLRSVGGLIPSLFTFFEDLKYLIACAGCLKQLLRPSRPDTVYTAFKRSFTYSNQVGNQYTLEVAESTFVVKPGQVDRLDIGYRQLWLYAMRHYREIPKEAKSKLLAKVVVERADENILSALAVLANRVGFESAEIYDLKRRSSDSDIARNMLLNTRRPDQYQYNNSTLEASVFSSPSLASDSLKTPQTRCGFPDEDSYEQDQTNGRDQGMLALVEEEGLAVVEQEMISLVEEGGPAEVELERVERVQQERFVQEWIEQEVLKQEA
ncbi:hypothetical protein V495_00220 [Pseudogymnoascus sp. VKM F-4514 (FW-929)]|nr:hypothetical protein V495_00220 [Pseudogymnoascus sp. VKM F-4514 (FW-929)]KFY67339.1 hypothetical protein V497_00452 [Pseudogymnoascus sp. VKM F-4516 (FW-969)]